MATINHSQTSDRTTLVSSPNGSPNDSPNGSPNASPKGSQGVTNVSLRTLRAQTKAGKPFACLTCYDAASARWLARAGVPLLLVGDTAAEMTLGYERTLDMPLDVLLALTAGVYRGVAAACADTSQYAATRSLVMGDMPFLSYQASDETAIINAGKFLTVGRADIVKLEVDGTFAPLIGKLTRAGIPVCAHLGSRPQRAALTGGYAAAGRTEAEAEEIVSAARACIAAGAVMLLLEAVPEAVTAKVMAVASEAGVPVIGIGAGAGCDGQVLVLNDLLGLSDRPPSFAKPVASLGRAIMGAGEQWVELVAARGVGPSPYSSKPANK